MKYILRTIRHNSLINGIVRRLIKYSFSFSSNFHSNIIKRWPTAGIVDCRFENYKFKFFSDCDDGLTYYIYYGLPYPERADLILFTELCKKSSVIIDIGANTGLFSILASKANSDAEIYSIEPYTTNAERLKINTKLNAFKNINIFELAIGEEDGKTEIAIPQNKSVTDVASINKSFSANVYPDMNWSIQQVEIQKLDSFGEKNNLRVDLIKCDVETLEMSVFKGATRILSHDKPTIIFECFLDEERRIFFNNILDKFQYFVYIILDQGVVHIKEGFTPTLGGLNYLITPVKPSKTFVSLKNIEELWNSLLIRS
jgi:FkbM family methyltransferase